MRTIRIGSVALVTCMLLGACGEQSGTDRSTSRDASSSAPASATAAATEVKLAEAAPDGSRIPDGTWAKTSTAADARRLGLPSNISRQYLGQDGEFHTELRIKGENWAQFGDEGDSEMATGDGGTAGYDADGNWVTTSTSPGCPGCVATFGWSMADERLTLTLLDTVSADDPMDVLVGRLVSEGTYAHPMKTSLACFASLALLLGACGWNDKPESIDGAGSDLVWGSCPDAIAITLTARHRCGMLTVPVDHRKPDGPRLTLDVVEAWPASNEDATGVAASVGFNFGEPAHDPGSMALLAERLGVAVVGLAPRGVGSAGGTALDCPELGGFGASQVGQPDAAGREAFLTAVQGCRDRLSGDGVDPSAFGLDDLAADLEALRTAMDTDRWHALVTYGELGRLSDVYAASFGDHARAIVKDSPPPAGTDSFTAAPEGTRSALAALYDECRDDRRCSSRYPELNRSWRHALERVAAQPLSGTLPDGAILIDGPKLLRAVRAMLGGDGPVYVADLPRVITAAAEGEIHPRLASVVAADPGYCNGYRPLCTKPGFSLGAYLSQVCPEVGTDEGVRDDDALYRGVFGESPYVEACALWDVPSSPAPEVQRGVPTLVLTGHLDAWSRAEWFDAAVVVRGATHDVAGSSPCVLEIRNPWVADPEADPKAGPCDSAPAPAWD